VDDHFFIRILQKHLGAYNSQRQNWAARIKSHGQIIDGGRIWYRGDQMPDDRPEEYDNDLSFPILDLSSSSPRSPTDAQYTYSIHDVDRISAQLGIPWEASKDIPFSPAAPFIGITWNLESKTIELPQAKKDKYLVAIAHWESNRTHTLSDTQKLYGKLLHASLVFPAGRAYLTSLESMLAVFDNRPFVPHHPPKECTADLRWWSATLCSTSLARSIPGPREATNFHAYSDASSGVGLAVWIDGKWRAWYLLPNWQRDGRDIAWAEAVAFELLAIYSIQLFPGHACLKLYGDNRGVIEGWWKGRSRNKAVNNVFKRVHRLSEEHQCSFLTRYVPSKHNPADDPSRGIFPPACLLLPPIPLPAALTSFIGNIPAPQNGRFPSPAGMPLHTHAKARNNSDESVALINHHLERQGEELLQTSES
jgi:hypothetical protein